MPLGPNSRKSLVDICARHGRVDCCAVRAAVCAGTSSICRASKQAVAGCTPGSRAEPRRSLGEASAERRRSFDGAASSVNGASRLRRLAWAEPRSGGASCGRSLARFRRAPDERRSVAERVTQLGGTSAEPRGASAEPRLGGASALLEPELRVASRSFGGASSEPRGSLAQPRPGASA